MKTRFVFVAFGTLFLFLSNITLPKRQAAIVAVCLAFDWNTTCFFSLQRPPKCQTSFHTFCILAKPLMINCLDLMVSGMNTFNDICETANEMLTDIALNHILQVSAF